MAGGRLAGTGLTGVQELAKAPGVAALAVSISMQGSALLILTGLQSRDCVRNSKGGEAEIIGGFYL